MNWWILEDALRDSKGHWCEYIETFREGLDECGDSLEIFCAGDATPEIKSRFEAKPALPPSIWARMGDGAPKWQRLLRVFSHGNATYNAVKKLNQAQPTKHQAQSTSNKAPATNNQQPTTNNQQPTILFVPTVLVHHLWGWWRLLNGPLLKSPCKVLLFFPNTPIFIDAEGSPKLNREPTAKIFHWLIRRLKKHVLSGKLILGAETHSMVDALTQVTGVKFTYLPHPVRLKEAVQASAITLDEEETNNNHEPSTKHQQPTTNNQQPTTLTLGAYGAARFEKGSELIQLAAKQILESQAEHPIQFYLQWLGDYKDDQGRLLSKNPELENHPKFHYITEYFKGNGYHEQLAKTDIMLLPYREAYQLRVSRVVIEAMLYGIPVIASERTTLWEQAERYGAGLPCSVDKDGSSLAKAIEQAISEYPRLREQAEAKKASAARHFSVQTFRELLTDQG